MVLFEKTDGKDVSVCSILSLAWFLMFMIAA